MAKPLKVWNGSAWTEVALALPSGYAALNSPTFTGIPAAPTAVLGTNTTQLATTAFVINQTTSTINSSVEEIEILTIMGALI